MLLKSTGSSAYAESSLMLPSPSAYVYKQFGNGGGGVYGTKSGTSGSSLLGNPDNNGAVTSGEYGQQVISTEVQQKSPLDVLDGKCRSSATTPLMNGWETTTTTLTTNGGASTAATEKFNGFWGS